MKLARMLMVRKDCGYTAIDMLGHEQEGLDTLIGLHCVFDSLSHVQATISCFQKNSIEWASYWKGAKKPSQVVAIHDLKHPAQRPLVNSVLEAEAGCLADRSSPTCSADESGIGTSRHFAATHNFGRFWCGRIPNFAVLRLMTNSNFAGSSTDKSAGFVPFNILAEKTSS